MINLHLKNPRTGFHLDVLNKSAHYMKLINSKPEVDTTWGKGGLAKPTRSRMARSLDQSRNQDNLRLMAKIVSIQKRSLRYLTEDSQPQRSLKNRHREYEKELAISEDNVRMVKKLGKVESELSKKKMDSFSASMKKYGKLGKSSRKNAAFIDDMLYRNYKIEMLRNRAESASETANHSKFTRKKHKKQTKAIAQRIQPPQRVGSQEHCQQFLEGAAV